MLADSLIVIDLQNGVCFNGLHQIEDLDQVINTINQRIQCYREANKPIIFVQHRDEDLIPNSYAWQLISALDATNSDYYVQKTHANAFFHTNLQTVLEENTVKTLEICGAQTQYCVDTTVKMAHGLGYQLQMCKGITTTYDNQYMNAKQTIAFYENIWDKRFVTFIDA
jgi:nicotinamidase-related amidase